METQERSTAAMADILDQLAMGVIAGPDDLMGMGECLNLLEALENLDDISSGRKQNINRLKLYFNRLILEDSKDPEADWKTIQNLLTDLYNGKVSEESWDGFPDGGEESAAGEDADDTPAQAVEEESEGLRWEPEEPEESREVMPTGPAGAKDASDDHEEFNPVEIQDLDLLKDFVEEAREHLASIELNMLALETDPKDSEAINAVFRPFHSVKGVAGFLNLSDVHHLSHEVENLLDAARSGTLNITDAVIDIVLSAVDILKVLMGELDKVLNGGPGTLYHSSPLVLPFISRVKNFHKDGPPAEPGTPVRNIGQILVERGVVEEDVVEDFAEQSKASGRKLGEELITEGVVPAREVSSALREQRHAKENAASVRIDTQKLDNLVDMVGELVIAQSMVLQNAEVQRIKEQKLQKDTVQLRRITAELQRISMSMRMVPIRGTFQKMIRLVRDLCRKSGKDVTLQMIGEETEIDRNMVEEIYEPLVHMIRNAVDHGVEMPEERKQIGKEPQGVIVLTAEQKGGNIVIEIEDDGKGLDARKIRAKAIERGVISAEELLDEKALFELIFHAGFSTRDTVTEVSGRGVGMDVVKKSIERLRGKVEISSVLGRGTRFEIKLPLTMAIIDGMVIRIGRERYVVPTIALKESLRPGKDAYMTVQGKGEMIKVRNTLMPLVRLHRMFGVETQCEEPWEGLLLVVSEDNRSYCLLADEILGRQEVVIKSLGAALSHLVGVSGGAILGDGKVALIIDVKGVVSLYEDTVR